MTRFCIIEESFLPEKYVRTKSSVIVICSAVFLFSGICKADSASIEKLLRQADSGDVNSQFILAKKYYIGQGVVQDYDEAAKWYAKAADQNYAKAQYELGTMYDNGQGVSQNYNEAIKWYAKAAEQGNAKAMHSLGLMYNKGQEVRQDSKEAIKWFTKAATLGNAKAQYLLGTMYCKNKDEEVLQDYKEAAKWFTKAAAQGEAKAQYVLGMMYCRGDGVEQDYKTAARWLTKAASQGLAEAQLVLAACYWNGKGVPEDYVESYKWMLLAAMNGDKNAQLLKKDLHERMTPQQIEEAQQRLNRVIKIKGFLAETNGSKNNEQPAENIESTSTGFLITPDGFILTACHSVGKTENVEVTYNQKQYTAKVILKDESIDAAVIKIDGNDLPYLPITSSADARTGDTVFTMGYPQVSLQGTEPKFTEGSISSLSGIADNPHYFQISVPVQPGNSGGPLVNKKGEVIGLIVAKLNDVTSLLTSGSVPQNVNYALKSSFVLSFIDSVPDLSQKIKIAGTAKDRSVAIERAKKSVVLIIAHR